MMQYHAIGALVEHHPDVAHDHEHGVAAITQRYVAELKKHGHHVHHHHHLHHQDAVHHEHHTKD